MTSLIEFNRCICSFLNMVYYLQKQCDTFEWWEEEEYNPGVSVFKGVKYDLTDVNSSGVKLKQVMAGFGCLVTDWRAI